MPPSGAAPLVYLITDRHATQGRPLDEVIGQALRALPRANLPPSAVAVQLREKDLDGRALLDLARRLRILTAAAGARLFVNDRVDVALAAGADGVHLGRGALAVDDVRAIAPELQIALATHSVDDVARAAADDRVSFVVFGPVFDTPSKRAYGPPLGLNLLRAAAASPVPVLAIGGVDRETISACLAAGASGVACIRPILGNGDPETALRGFFEAIERT
jgi:thiamine-phosphate pyrophosphorylase